MNLTLRNNPIAPTLLGFIRHLRSGPSAEATLTVKVDTGRTRAAMVAKYMEEQAVALRAAWDRTAPFPPLAGEAAMLQAGAAGAEAMSNLLHALLAGDKEEFKAHLTSFVNDAVDTGVVA